MASVPKIWIFNFKDNEVYEDETIIYTPINIVRFNWMMDATKKMKLIRNDYEKEKNNYNILGLVVYKKDGGWCWLEKNKEESTESDE